jgi:hypothetical protein
MSGHRRLICLILSRPLSRAAGGRSWRDGGHELHWKVYARNKRSIVLNLHHDNARMALVRLASPAGTRHARAAAILPGTLADLAATMNLCVLQRASPSLLSAWSPRFFDTRAISSSKS